MIGMDREGESGKSVLSVQVDKICIKINHTINAKTMRPDC